MRPRKLKSAALSLFTATLPHHTSPPPLQHAMVSAFVLGCRVPGVKESSADLLEVEPVAHQEV